MRSKGRRGVFPKPCREPGCINLAYDNYCEDHRPSEYRASAHKRGYDGRWRRARLAYLASHPTCVHCMSRGEVVPAVVVDHIRSHKGDRDLFWDRSNWQSLCKSCHDRKTASEDMGSWDTKKGLV